MENIAKSIDLALSNELMPIPEFNNIYINNQVSENNYKIALIPMKIDSAQFEVIKDAMSRYKLLKLKSNISEEFSDYMLESSKIAANLGAKLIVFSELSYPIGKSTELNYALNRICKKNDCFIVAGSYHEIEKKDKGLHKSIIFSPYSNKNFSQIKITRGFFQGRAEEIKVPNKKAINIFKTRYGSFIVALGTDILDRNLEWNIRMLNRPNSLYAPIDLIINPCYADNPHIISRICRILSKTANSYVAFVNNDADKEQPEVFICGDRVEPCQLDDFKHGNIEIYMFNINPMQLNQRRINTPYFEIERL